MAAQAPRQSDNPHTPNNLSLLARTVEVHQEKGPAHKVHEAADCIKIHIIRHHFFVFFFFLFFFFFFSF